MYRITAVCFLIFIAVTSGAKADELDISLPRTGRIMRYEVLVNIATDHPVAKKDQPALVAQVIARVRAFEPACMRSADKNINVNFGGPPDPDFNWFSQFLRCVSDAAFHQHLHIKGVWATNVEVKRAARGPGSPELVDPKTRYSVQATRIGEFEFKDVAHRRPSILHLYSEDPSKVVLATESAEINRIAGYCSGLFKNPATKEFGYCVKAQVDASNQLKAFGPGVEDSVEWEVPTYKE